MLLIGRTPAKQLPHGADGWMRLRELRFTEIDVDGVKAAAYVRDLGYGIPTFISLFPAVAIGQSQVTPAQQLRADRRVRAKDDRDGVCLIARALGVEGFDGKSPIPSTELKEEVVGDSWSRIF